MKFSFPSSWLLLILATPSVDAKKGKKTKNAKIKNLGRNLNCDPMTTWDCKNLDCASDMWEDGCLACMCYNTGNASWCDGSKSVYYDVYFDEHGVNPFGDSRRENRKCNTDFGQENFSCRQSWECDSELECCFGSGKCCRGSDNHYYSF